MTSRKLEFIAPPGERTIVTRRVVDADRALVFETWTKPEHLKRWWGPYVLTMVTCEVDLRVGGRYRFVERARDGQTFGFQGEFKEIARPERIVRTFLFDGMPDADALETVTFDEQDGKTTIRSTTVHRTVEARDRQVAWPLEDGLVDTYERLDNLLVSLRVR